MAGYLAFVKEIKHAFPNSNGYEWSRGIYLKYCFYTSVLSNVQIYKDHILFDTVSQTYIDKIIDITKCTSWVVCDGKNRSCYGEHFKFDRFCVMFYDKSNIKNYMVYSDVKSYSVINDICAAMCLEDCKEIEKLREQVRCLDFRPIKEIPYKPVFLD